MHTLPILFEWSLHWQALFDLTQSFQIAVVCSGDAISVALPLKSMSQQQSKHYNAPPVTLDFTCFSSATQLPRVVPPTSFPCVFPSVRTLGITMYLTLSPENANVIPCGDYEYRQTADLTALAALCGMGALTATWLTVDGYTLSSQNYSSGVFPYSTSAPTVAFQFCSACSDSKCDECNTYKGGSAMECDSCYGYVTQQSVALQSSPCLFCENSTYSNCLQCNVSAPSQCITCNDGYFLNDTYVTVNTTTVIEITNSTNVTLTYTQTTFEHVLVTNLTVVPLDFEIDVLVNVTTPATNSTSSSSSTTSSSSSRPDRHVTNTSNSTNTTCSIGNYTNGSCLFNETIAFTYPYTGASYELVNTTVYLEYNQLDTFVNSTFTNTTTVIVTTTTEYPTYNTSSVATSVLVSYWIVTSSTSTNNTNVTILTTNSDFTYTPNIQFSLAYSNYSNDGGSYTIEDLSVFSSIFESYNITYDLTYDSLDVLQATTTTIYDNIEILNVISTSNSTLTSSTSAVPTTYSYEYLDYHACDACGSAAFPDGCSRCNVTSCLECDSGRALVSTTNVCLECSLQSSINLFLYLFKDYRCSQCTSTSATTCNNCDVGFQNSTYDSSQATSTCQLKCGTHQYPSVSFTTVNLDEDVVSQTICNECPTICKKCVGSSSSSDCTECNAGYYLSFTDLERRSGTCIQKSTGSNIIEELFVSSNAVDIARNGSLRDGSFSAPFVDLSDAITRGKELASIYSNTVTIYIFLFNGTHYLLRDRGGSVFDVYQQTQYYDPLALNYQLYIQPLNCSYTPSGVSSASALAVCSNSILSILNKRREIFILDVAISLQLYNIELNAADSILPPDTPCLNERRSCCSITSSTITNVNSSDTFSCSTALTNLNLTEYCSINSPNTLFRMRLNNQSQVSSPNQLTLLNVTIKNLFYDMNSLVNLTQYGGYVTFQNSKFQRISICGSLIKNTFSNYPAPDLTQVSSLYLSDYQRDYASSVTQYQFPFIDRYYWSYLDVATSPFTCTSTCFQVQIKNSNFTQMPYKKNLQTSLSLISSSNGLRYQGSILTLVSMPGEIRIQDSTFSNNLFYYDGCHNIINSLTNSPSSASSANNFQQLYNSGSAFNLYQIKALINIISHPYGLYIYNNTFTNNNGLKGIINIGIAEQNNYPLIINGNTFTLNSGILDSNVLSIRKTNVVNLLGSSYSAASDLRCGGIQLSSNTFTYNVGCTPTNGVLFLYCYDDSHSQPTGIISYISSYDSQYFIGNSGSFSLMDSNVSAVSTSTYSDTYTSSIKSSVSTTFTINLEETVLTSNNYTNNFAGAGNQSIVTIQGFPSVLLTSETYVNNQNYFPTAYRTYSPMYSMQSSSVYPTVLSTITQDILDNYSNKSQSITTIVRALYLKLTSNTYTNNFVVDANTIYKACNRSNGLLLIDFYGYLNIEKSTFSSHQGVAGSNLVASKLSNINNGFNTYLLAFSRSMFSQLLFDTLTFSNNVGYYDESQYGSPYPLLFNFDSSMVDFTYLESLKASDGESLYKTLASYYTFTSITITSNVIYNGEGMVSIGLPYFLMTSWNVKNNGNSYDQNGGGLILISSNTTSYISISSSTFSSNTLYGGAVIRVRNSNITSTSVSSSPNIMVSSSTFSSNTGYSYTSSLLFESNAWMYVQLTSVQFSDNYGAVTNDLYFEEIYQLEITSITWKASQNNQNKAQFIYKNVYDTYLTVTSSTFSCGVTYDSTAIKTFEISLYQYYASLFRIETPSIQSSSSNVFTSNSYTQCNQVYQGSVFYIGNGSEVYDNKSSYTSNSALFGGVAFVTGYDSYLQIGSPSSVSQNVAYYGGVFFVQNQASVYVTSATFGQNDAYEGSLCYLQMRAQFQMNTAITVEQSNIWKRSLIMSLSGSWFSVMNATLKQNTAAYDSVIIYASNVREPFNLDYAGTTGSSILSDLLVSELYDCTIELNTVTFGGRAISLIDGAMDIRDCTFTQNYIYQETEGVFLVSATLWISNSVFYEDYNSYYYTQLSNNLVGDMSGTYISVGRNSSLYAMTLTFYGGRAQYGGCVSVQGSASAYIYNSTFKMCVAYLGGAIYATNYNSLVIDSCDFSTNIVFKGYGQNILSMNSKTNLTIINSTMTSYHNSVYARDTTLVSVDSISMSPEALQVSGIPYQEYAGGLELINARSLTISGSNTFTSLKGKNGGAIYISLDLNIKAEYSPIKYTITGLTVTDCQSTGSGGALYLQNLYQLNMSVSTLIGNTAVNGSGGGIYFDCNDEPTDNCTLDIKSTSITGNSAQIGGGIYWDYREPVMASTLTLSGNSATTYGHNIASFARELVKIDDASTYTKYFNKSSTDIITVTTPLTSFSFENVQSGGFIPTVYFGVVDKYGQIVPTTSGKMIQFKLNSSNSSDGEFQTSVSGVSEFFSAYGVFNVSGLLIISSPGSSQALEIVSFDAVDLNQPTNQAYLSAAFQESPLTVYEIPVSLGLRNCIEGEALSTTGACSKCPTGTYLIFPPTTPQDCIVCPSTKATCLGGSDIGPLPGYWRKSNETDDFIICYVNASCLGFVAPDYNPVGDCAEGYYGALCSACMPGYSRSGSYSCSKCPANLTNILRITGIMIGIVGVLSYMVYSTIKGATKKNLSSVYIKICTNHLQMISIMSSFQMNWPTQLTSFFSSSGVVSSSSSAIVSFDCWMDTTNASTIDRYDFYANPHDFRVVYQKMLIIAGLPIFVVIVSVVVWSIILKAYNQLDQLETKVIATIVILSFLVHPSITETMVDMFDCHTFDSDLRLNEDLQVICYTGLHKILSLGVALPCLIVYGIGIPGIVLVLMKKESERLDTRGAKEKFGFLYNGYKRKNYYWEIIIMYRKILCIFISIFMNSIGVIVQALIIMIVLVVFMQMNSMRRPFIARALNDIEDLSLMTSVVTIYCGLFFISSKDKTDADFDPDKDFYLNNTGQLILFAVILVANLVFFLTWGINYIVIMRQTIKEKFKTIYICLFLCCRVDKYEKENEKLAQEQKRETIIEKIEDVQFFLKSMKRMYTKQIFYEGHLRFMKMLYFVEFEKAQIDLTEKKHNFYIQGKMARDRKFDPDRMKAILDQNIIEIDEEFGGRKGKSRRLQKVHGEQIGNADLGDQDEEMKSSASFANSLKGLKRVRSHYDSSLAVSDSLQEINSTGAIIRIGREFKGQGNDDDLSTSRMDESTRKLLPGEEKGKKGLKLKLMATKYLIEDDEDEKHKAKKEKWAKNFMESRLGRTRNDIQKLRKHLKERLFISGKDEEEEEEEKGETDSFFREGLQNYIEDNFEPGESLEDMRVIRQLTKRYKAKEKKSGGQKHEDGGSRLLATTQAKQAPKIVTQNSGGSVKLNASMKSVQEDLASFSQEQQVKLFSIYEALKYIEMNKEKLKNKPLQLTQQLRPPTQMRKQILVDNFCQEKMSIQEYSGHLKHPGGEGNKKKKKCKNTEKYLAPEFEEADMDEIQINLSDFAGDDENDGENSPLRNQKTLEEERRRRADARSAGKRIVSKSSSFGTDSSLENSNQVYDEELVVKMKGDVNYETEQSKAQRELL